MNPFEMIVFIVGIVMIASVLKSRRRHHAIDADPATEVENQRLKDEVRQLKERVHVLERIAVEKEDTLSRQIEELRDR